jgi:hypothetical protein
LEDLFTTDVMEDTAPWDVSSRIETTDSSGSASAVNFREKEDSCALLLKITWLCGEMEMAFQIILTIIQVAHHLFCFERHVRKLAIWRFSCKNWISHNENTTLCHLPIEDSCGSVMLDELIRFRLNYHPTGVNGREKSLRRGTERIDELIVNKINFTIALWPQDSLFPGNIFLGFHIIYWINLSEIEESEMDHVIDENCWIYSWMSFEKVFNDCWNKLGPKICTHPLLHR